MTDEPVGAAIDDSQIGRDHSPHGPRAAQAEEDAQTEDDRRHRGRPSDRGYLRRRWTAAECPLQCRHREEADINKGDPPEHRTAGLRRTRLTSLDHSLIPRRVEQLDAALGTEDEQDDGVTAGPHNVRRNKASSIDSPGPKAIASTRPDEAAFSTASSTKKIPALEALPSSLNTRREVARAPVRSRSARSIASKMPGPPGCAATRSISARLVPAVARNVSTTSSRWASTICGNSRLRTTRSPPSRSS